MATNTEPASYAERTETNATRPTTTAMGEVIHIDHAMVREHLERIVVSTVQDTLNALLDAEADRLCGAGRCERSEERADTRVGHYTRQLQTKAGEVSLKVPKLRSLPFETAIFERYKRRESSVEEALWETRRDAAKRLRERNPPPQHPTFNRSSSPVLLVGTQTMLAQP
jgi:hypothetical protein